MSMDFDDVLKSVPSTDEVMNVNTDFMKSFRSTPEPVKVPEPAVEVAEPVLDGAEAEAEYDGASEELERDAVEPALTVEQILDVEEDSLGDALERDRENDQAEGSAGASSRSHQRGGSGGGSGSAAGAVGASSQAGQHHDQPPAAPEEESLRPERKPAEVSTDHDDDEALTISQRKTDQQDEIQRLASAGGSGSSSRSGEASADPLPQTGFAVDGAGSQPHIRALPEVIVSALREVLRSAAVRELKVSDREAREFAQRLSQASLVTAFLLAQLDLRLSTDASTAKAMELFRSRDPLLGSVAQRLEQVEVTALQRSRQLDSVIEQLRSLQRTAAVLEQAQAYAIADRELNFLRGSHDPRQAPITNKDAIWVRDRSRDLTDKQVRVEKERDGRPIR